MHTNALSELSTIITERGIITTDVIPFCLLNPNHTGHALTKMLKDVANDDIAAAFDITTMELIRERSSAPTLEDAVAMLMSSHSENGNGWLVRAYYPSPRGGFNNRLIYAPTLVEVMRRMLQA